MSENNVKIPVVSVLDPRLNYNKLPSFTTIRTAQAWTTTQTVAQQPIGSSVQFNVITNNRQTAINRKALVQSTWTFTVTGTNTSGGPLLSSGYVAPRQYPFHSAISAMNHTIGQAPVVATTYNTYNNQLAWFKQDYNQVNTELSQCASFPDQSFYYESLTNSQRNPLGSYADSAFDSTGRGGVAGFVIQDQSANNIVATCTLTTTEELMISPFVWGNMSNEQPSFFGIEQMNFIFAMDLSRPLSIVQNQGTSGSINITSVSAVINSASLLLQQYTPEASIEQPLQMVLPYSQVTRYQTQGPTVTPFQTGISITANNLQFNSIPRYVFGYSSRPDQSRTSFMTDAIFPLSNPLSLGKPVNFLFDNRPNLNTATAWDLYLMSVRAGLMMSWTQWSSQVGSIVCVDLGAGDIGLQDWQSPSVTGNYNVQISMVFDNPFNETINMVLNILAVYDGTFNMRNNVTTVSPSILTPEDVLKARQNDSVQAFEASKTIAGGSFLDVIKQVGNFGKKAYCDPTARKVICGEALPSLAAIGMAGKAAYCNPSLRKAVCGSGVVGNGVVGGCGQCCGGARSGGVRKKKSMKGGRRMTKRELQRRIM